jgi:hypothetical protein
MIIGKVIEKYKSVLKRNIPFILQNIEQDELNEAIDYSINKRFKDSKCTIDNNYKNLSVNTSIAKLTEYILSKKPILTSYGCLFTKHGTVENPIYDLITEFTDIRDNVKKKMFKYPKGSEMFNKYNLLQLLAKLDNNAQ